MPKVIQGFFVKEMFCKNDECRALLGYENFHRGVVIFICRRCGHESIFKKYYTKMNADIDKLIGTMKGGEK